MHEDFFELIKACFRFKKELKKKKAREEDYTVVGRHRLGHSWHGSAQGGKA